ncbi:MAG: murein biosynthesis integral membrane protein MurJ [Acidobacteria bacterium]|nr:murein biosynthesis integral membrane protein MurJ [Acidobacteriota bacterium]
MQASRVSFGKRTTKATGSKISQTESGPVLDRGPDAAEPGTPQKPPAAHAALVGAGILISRVFGFARESVMAFYLGASGPADAFRAALRIPNFLQNLLGEGVLSASFIPVYAKLIAEKDEKAAGRVAGIIFSLLVVVVGVLVIAGMLLAEPLVDLIAGGFSGVRREMTISLTRILFPGVGLLVLSAWCLGILNSHRMFFLSYVAPTILNLVMIGTLIYFGARIQGYSLVTALAWGTVVGMFLQFAVQVPFVYRYAPTLRYGLDAAFEPVREIIRNFVPVVLGRGVVQVSAFIDMAIVSLLAAGTMATLGYAQVLYLLPVSLFGMSVAASELPKMSSVLAPDAEAREILRERLHAGLRQIAFFIAPSAMAFVFIGDVLVAAIYERGRFTSGDTRLVWYILITISIGLLAATFSRLLSSTYYAMRDTRTPLRYAIVRITVSAALAYLFAIPLRPLIVELFRTTGIPIPAVTNPTNALGLIGIAIGGTVGGWVEYFLLKRTLTRRIGKFSEEPSFLMKLWSAALGAGIVASLAARPAAEWVRSIITGRFGINHIAGGAVAALIFGLAYLTFAALLRIPETRKLLRRIPLLRRWA